jgi:hypothetical protein
VRLQNQRKSPRHRQLAGGLMVRHDPSDLRYYVDGYLRGLTEKARHA